MMQRSTIIILVIGVVVVGGLLFAATTTYNTSTAGSTTNQQEDSTVDTAEVKIEDIKVGEGAEAVSGKTVSVHYVGTLLDGTKFDSSRDRGEPFTFVLGQGSVIEGWDKGVVGMKVGGIRKLTIPPALGYGSQDHGPIPANSILIFEIELLDVK